MTKAHIIATRPLVKLTSLLAFASLLLLLASFCDTPKAYSIGFISHHTANKLPSHWQNKYVNSYSLGHHSRHGATANKGKHLSNASQAKIHATAKQPVNQTSTQTNAKTLTLSWQNLLAKLQTKEILPGITYKHCSGALRLNILDIDTTKAPVIIKPIVSPPGTARLQTVKEHTANNHALAAINANYFKNTGTPLGTLIVDGDWVSGPLYDRVALGISHSGFVRIDRVGLGGMLYTSNEHLPQVWINNINSPRRTGCRTIAYTRRWGNVIRLPYAGCLVAINAQGRVTDTNKKEMAVPYGGMVLTDSEDSAIASLQAGDQTYLRWQVTPNAWTDVSQAVSGGPLLIKNGAYSMDLQSENFRSNWTSSSIKARTACGVTADNHLLLVTAEGTHTLYDLAHILHELGAVDAMNFDGGGSTTMVIHNATVNMENKSNERRVAAALGIFTVPTKNNSPYNKPCTYVPQEKSLDIVGNKLDKTSFYQAVPQEEKIVQDLLNQVFNLNPTITAQNPLENHPVAN